MKVLLPGALLNSTILAFLVVYGLNYTIVAVMTGVCWGLVFAYATLQRSR